MAHVEWLLVVQRGRANLGENKEVWWLCDREGKWEDEPFGERVRKDAWGQGWHLATASLQSIRPSHPRGQKQAKVSRRGWFRHTYRATFLRSESPAFRGIFSDLLLFSLVCFASSVEIKEIAGGPRRACGNLAKTSLTWLPTTFFTFTLRKIQNL